MSRTLCPERASTTLTLQFLTDGTYDAERNLFLTPSGQSTCFVATDHFQSAAYRVLTVDDLFDIAVRHGLHFDQLRERGVVFHMLAALGDRGRCGLTAVGNSHAEADAYYRRAREVFDREAAEAGGTLILLCGGGSGRRPHGISETTGPDAGLPAAGDPRYNTGMRPLRAVSVGLLLVMPPLATRHAAQRQAEPAGHVKSDQVFQTSVEVVNVTATVTDENGRLIPDLDRDAFTIHENGELQQITQFYRGRVPVSMGIVLDVSDSMRGQRMDDARFALERFIGDLLKPTDEVFLVSFNHSPQLVAPWTTPPGDIGRPLDAVRPFGGTAIYDAMAEAIPRFRDRTHQRAAILLISDGSDTASDANVRDIKRQLRRSDAFVYAIAIDDEEKRPINDRVNEFTLKEMTDESGGYTEVIHDIEDLGPATARIADELNQQYMLGYTPTTPPDNTFRAIRVRVKGSQYMVRARKGYTAIPFEERRRNRDR